MMSTPNNSQLQLHARHIEAVVHGRGRLEVSEWVRRSWARCLDEYSLDPGKSREPVQLNRHELTQRRHRLGSALAIAELEMQGLRTRLNDSCGIILTDAEGVILSYLADAAFDRDARHWGFRPGVIWSEAEQGTNGMGTCLAACAPIVVNRSEHFLAQNTGLTCYAAPIRDEVGALIGALDVSGRVDLPSSALLALLDLTTQNIQNRLLLSQAKHHYLLRFHTHPAFVGTLGEGLLAIDERGQICGANHAAAELLSGLVLCGNHVATVLGFDVSDLERHARAGITHPRVLPTHERIADLLYGWVSLPERRSIYHHLHAKPIAQKDATRPNALRDAEREALRAVLMQCEWNVSLAARQLGLSRRTLHRKLRQHQLFRHSQS